MQTSTIHRNESASFSALIKAKAIEMGFAQCGIAKAGYLSEYEEYISSWLQQQFQAGMGYMERNLDKRLNPCLLEESAKSVIVVLIPYAQNVTPNLDYDIAAYAHCPDYHEIIRAKLYELLQFMRSVSGSVIQGRAFTDSAPVLERAWATQAGLGWQGKNFMLINKELGSYFFIGELIVDVELAYDEPFTANYCGQCRKCVEACPNQAITPNGIDARRCISYLTIEHRSDYELNTPKFDSCIFGCDICQNACPWNKKTRQHAIPQWISEPATVFPEKVEDWLQMTESDFRQKYKGTALYRTGLKLIQRNVNQILEFRRQKNADCL
jgi:epoxyqueuosine reductase